MAVKFRKSVNLGGGVKLNLNKKSVGISAGVKGARVSANSSGRKTVTTGIPGTGLYSTKTISGSKSTDSEPDGIQAMQSPVSSGSPAFATFMSVMGGILVVLFGLIALASPVFGLIGVAFGVFLFVSGRKMKKRIRQSAE